MNTDPTENIRREDQARLNAEAAERAELVKQYGIVWSTDELREAFEVLGFMAPYVIVRSKYTGKRVAACCAISTVIPYLSAALILDFSFRRYPQLPNELALLLAQDRACKMCHKILQQRFQFRTG
jgi:hypothetical protein